ncbi:MAG: ABC transporter ATP-binding protein [Betaproteobacteria bacterium]|nr:ABC transporter ATP-binding protein [Betaproteobacteria bacterium]
MSLLEARAVNSYYGDSHVLFDIDFDVEPNEVVALLGRNGAGKTTLLHSIMGVIRPRSGRIAFAGEPIEERDPYEIARRDIQLVPETRRIFSTLSVEENLKIAALTSRRPLELGWIYEVFPRLKERRRSRGGNLSGGEQQMLAVARALIRDPKLLMLDEPFEGLAPVIVRDLSRVIRELVRAGRTIVIVEQNVRAALQFAHRVYVLNNGHMVYHGTPKELLANAELTATYLGAAV